MKRLLILSVVLLFAAWGSQAFAQASKTNGVSPGPVNLLQDCWTTSLALDPDPELELYDFDGSTDFIDFLWKHKIIAGCSAYVARIYIWQCRDGKQAIFGEPIVFATANIPFGPVSPIPGIPEIIFPPVTLTPGTLPPGRYDWAIGTECDDTDGGLSRDGDIEDTCGLNLGLPPAVTPPVPLLGPDPIQIWDADPGGAPPGRGPGENGTTRPWCFQVTGSADGGAAAKAPVPVQDWPGRRVIGPEDGIKGDGVMDIFDAMEALDKRGETLQQQEDTRLGSFEIDNYPNPFSGETTLRYRLEQSGMVKLTVYDALGRQVRVLVEAHKPEGEHRVSFDGVGLSAGVYFYTLELEDRKVMGKMIMQD